MLLIEGDGEVFQDAAAEGGEFVGEFDEGAGELVVAEAERVGETADFLRAVAGEGADGGAVAGRGGEGGVEADGVEAEGGVAAGVDERDESAVAETEGDERGFAGVVEWMAEPGMRAVWRGDWRSTRARG